MSAGVYPAVCAAFAHSGLSRTRQSRVITGQTPDADTSASTSRPSASVNENTRLHGSPGLPSAQMLNSLDQPARGAWNHPSFRPNILADLTALPVRAGAFHAALNIVTLEHLRDPRRPCAWWRCTR